MTTRADRVMLEQLDWRHVKAAHTNANGTTVLTRRRAGGSGGRAASGSRGRGALARG